jgi:hypothetical protein
MNLAVLRSALAGIKKELEHAITSSTFNGEPRANGLKAKESFIRSHSLILPIHEVVKVSLAEKIEEDGRSFTIHPPVGQKRPELNIAGFLKRKDQDIVVLFDGDTSKPEIIEEGPLENVEDAVGREISERSLVIGVRSQMSSVNKNFDTLMERLFAETLNLRLRLPKLVMGEVYMLPVFEYDSGAMKQDAVDWQSSPVDIERFIKTFTAFSGRAHNEQEEKYKYERSALIFADFRLEQPKVYLTLEELKGDNLVSSDFEANFSSLSPANFALDLVKLHRQRHYA